MHAKGAGRQLITRRLFGPRQIQCAERFHIVRTAALTLRAATLVEFRIALAGASDDQAQRWFGWVDSDIYPEPHRSALLSLPSDGGERPKQPIVTRRTHLVAIDAVRLRVAGAISIDAMPAGFYVGGWLTPSYRGQGLGRELFGAALLYGHQHLGIEVLRAGAEASNTASRKSLEAVGFQPTQGVPTHQLPNGRLITSSWYEHVAPASHCRGLPLTNHAELLVGA